MSHHYEHLKQYYNSLALVDRRYQELQDSRAELLWYDKLAEADGLAIQHGLSKPLRTLQSARTNSVLPEPENEQAEIVLRQGDREQLLNVFGSLQEVLKRLQSFQGNFQHQLSNIQRSYETDLQSLRSQQEQLEEKSKKTLSLLDSAKMAVFLSLLLIAGITALAAYVSKNLNSTGITAFVTICGVAIFPIFCNRGLITAIFDRHRESQTYQELNRKVKEFRRLLPEEEDRLLQKKRSQEIQLRAELSFLRQDACNYLESIRAFTLCARYDVTEVKPQNLRDEWEKQHRILAQIINKLERPVWNWQDEQWQKKYTSPSPDSPSSLFRFGDLFIEREQGEVTVPAILTLRAHTQSAKQHWSGHTAMFSNDGDSRQAALQLMESLAVRTIASIPARSCKGIFIDPVNAGNIFPFRNFPSDIVGKQTYTRSEDICEQLRALAQHVEQVIQNYLSRNYDTIEQYNADSTAVSEAYRYIEPIWDLLNQLPVFEASVEQSKD